MWRAVAWYINEDSLCELVGALACLVSSMLLAAAWLRGSTAGGAADGSTGSAMGTLLLALVLFAAFGEEISWGQRLFDFRPPAFVGRLNRSNELNLHNLDALQLPWGDSIAQVAWFAGTFWYFTFWPAWAAATSRVGRKRRTWMPPVPRAPIAVAGTLNFVLFGAWLLLSIRSGAFVLPHEAYELQETGAQLLMLPVAFRAFRSARATSQQRARWRFSWCAGCMVSLLLLLQSCRWYQSGPPRRAILQSGLIMSIAEQLQQEGRYAEAIRLYEQALITWPENEIAVYDLGNIALAQGDLATAESHYRSALRMNPRLAEAHNNLAVVMSRTGRGEEASAHLREAIRLKPDYQEAIDNLRRLGI